MQEAPSADAAALGHRFVEAIVGHDWDGIASCFSQNARLVAVVPREHPFREKSGAEDAAILIKGWFGDADITELVRSEVVQVADRLRISYLIHEHEPDGWYLVEQVAYATLEDGRFADMNLACSGFQSVPA